MTTTIPASPLQQSYRQLIAPYAPYITIAATLTMKQRATISIPRFDNYDGGYYRYQVPLTEERIYSTIKYFNARLTQLLYGNNAKHKNKRKWAKPLVITCVEGCERFKREHMHLAIGNVPANKQEHINEFILQAWRECDFSYKQVDIKQVNNAVGWLGYMTKTVGYTDSDALDVVSSVIPQFIQDSICTESRLQSK